jgi:hypothetical protein
LISEILNNASNRLFDHSFIAGNSAGVALVLRPFDGRVLCLEARELVIGVILDNPVDDDGTFRPTFRTSFDLPPAGALVSSSLYLLQTRAVRLLADRR